MRSIHHATEGLSRPCTAWDMFIVSGGLQCGNCLAHNVPPMENGCRCITSDDKPCPLPAESDGKCWVHAMQSAD